MRILSFGTTCRSTMPITLIAIIQLSLPAVVRGQAPNGSEALSLNQAVALALASHPRAGAARAAEDAASAAVAEAKSARWPQLRAQAAVTRFEEPMIVAPLHGFDVMEPPEFDETLLRGDVTLNWSLYDGGARGARIRGARAAVGRSEAARLAAEMALMAEVTRAYLAVLTARELLEAHDRRLSALAAERRRVALFLEQGRAAQVELLRVDAALADAEAQRVSTRARLDLAERDLARLTGMAPEATRADRLLSVSLSEDAELENRDRLVQRSLAANPALEGARRDLEAALAGRRLAIAAWIPHVGLTGAYQGFSSTDADLTVEWQAGLSVSYPLFTGGARASSVAAAGAKVEESRERLRLAELETREAVDRAASAVIEANALVVAIARGERHQGEVVRIERLALEAGAGTQTDYIQAEAELLRVRSALAEARHLEIMARVELARIVGELTATWFANNLESEG